MMLGNRCAVVCPINEMREYFFIIWMNSQGTRFKKGIKTMVFYGSFIFWGKGGNGGRGGGIIPFAVISLP